MTNAETKAINYIRWHERAYGAPAPTDEIATLVGMSNATTGEMLESMQMRGHVQYTEMRWAAGWHLPSNTEAKPSGEATSA